MKEYDLDKGFYAMVFYATADTIKTERQARKNFKTAILPTPREISKSCGLAIRFFDGEEAELIKFTESRDVNCALYFLGDRSKTGEGRECTCLIKRLN